MQNLLHVIFLCSGCNGLALLESIFGVNCSANFQKRVQLCSRRLNHSSGRSLLGLPVLVRDPSSSVPEVQGESYRHPHQMYTNPVSYLIQFLRTNHLLTYLFQTARKYDKYLPAQDYFQKALYMFDIGQNDLAGAFYSKTLDQVLASIPIVLAEFEDGIEVGNFLCSLYARCIHPD